MRHRGATVSATANNRDARLSGTAHAVAEVGYNGGAALKSLSI